MQQDLFSQNTPAENLPVDQQVRYNALDPHTSFAVAAPAGSGKTGLLTQRALTLLAWCDEPEEVLAITFTRKAAGEMQDRILHALWQAADGPEPHDKHAQRTWALAKKVLARDAEREWNLLQSPQRLRVQTIDSLSRAITKQLPLASGLGAQPDTLENPEQAYRLAVRELFTLLEQDTPLRDDLAQLLRHLDNNLQAVENLLVGLLARREQWLGVLLQARDADARVYLEYVLQEVIVEHLQQLHDALLFHASDICLIADQAATHLQPEGEQKNRIHTLLGIAELPDAEPENIDLWLAFADLLLTNTGSYRARLTKAEGFPAGKEFTALKNQFAVLVDHIRTENPAAEALLHAVRELPPAHYDAQQWQLLASLTHILPQLAAQLMLVFKQLAATDYSAISQAALLALGDEDSPSDIALQLDYRIRHILVDEFQDTASPQLELLKKLTQGWQPGDGRTLFIVGDGMQSCYGFRNANVGLFLDARKQGIGPLPLHAMDLQVNFRSQAGVVNWINTIFSQAFPAQDDISRGAVKYSPSLAFKPKLENSAVNFFACTYTSDTKTYADVDENDGEQPQKLTAQKQEAATVLALVQQAQQKNPAGTIAILVRTRNHLTHILPALTRAGLPYQATDIDSLASRMAIMDLLSLTRALLNPSDRIAWLAILRAPWCGLDLHDLHAIATANLAELSPRLNDNALPVIWQQLQYFTQIPALGEDGKIILHRVVPLLQNAWQARYRKPLRQTVEGLWLALGGPATLLDANDLDNTHSFFALLDKHEQAGSIADWQTFTQAIERLFAAPQANADARLQVMTIHKSKGLEFDTVIIPGLDRAARRDDKQLLLWQERINNDGEKKLLLGSLAPTGRDEDKLYKFMRREAEKQQHFEATRLLYVGCTRAIKQLHLLACINSKENDLQAPSKNSLLSSIWDQIKESAQKPVTLQHAADVIDVQHDKPGLQHLLRLPVNWQPPLLADINLLQTYRGHEFTVNQTENPRNIPELETLHARLARHTGTVIHSALQAIVENGLITSTNSITADIFILQYKFFWRIQLQQLGWAGDVLNSALLKIEHALQQTLTHEQGRWLLNSSHEQSACELALMYHDEQGVREAIMDRTFIADGTRWIVDYKSSTPLDNESETEFIAREVEQYRPQLQRYQELMQQSETLPVRTALYFVAIALWVEIN